MIGPHHGYEAKLLLAGAKPVGVLATFPEHIPRDASIAKHDQEIETLLEAVRAGRLSVIEKRMAREQDDGLARFFFFCQKGLEPELGVIADWHERWWKDKNTPFPLPNDIGAYYGYTPDDIALWEQGGYGKPEAYFYTTIDPFRRYCRYKTMLMELNA